LARGAPIAASPPHRAAPSAHLTARIARGDEAAFAEFYELWFDRLYAMIRATTRRDESFCLDLVQDCMLRVVRSLPALADDRAVTAWMGRLAFTTALDRLRAESRQRQRETEAFRRRGDAVSPPAEAALEQERLDWLEAQLRELPEAERSLILGRFGEGKTLAAVGAASGLSGHAAHGRISRTLARLRHRAQRWFGHE
jgi:RNA polymerase sigma-70 factor (ECF subfamily)